MELRVECPPSSLPPSLLASGADWEKDEVMSEVHLGCPPGFSGPRISRFTFSTPIEDEAIWVPVGSELTSACEMTDLDEDGDLVLARRERPSHQSCILTIQHNVTSSIQNVGLQVWKAELLLADFVLHKIFMSSEFDGVVSFELGAGTGLVGILLARVAKTVFLTDHGDEILDNCAKNVHLNMFNSLTSIYVRDLNWESSWPPALGADNSSCPKRYSWTSSEIEEAQEASVLLAADVIYSDDLTSMFFATVEKLMSQGAEKVLYLALEKRYNFSLDDLDVVANGYSKFRSYLRVDGDHEDGIHGSSPYFVGKCLDLSQLPQYIREYERGNDFELWEIEYVKGV